ncbi:MAG: hypothetical protein QOJ45_2157 [Verrucomicrobiota bacterium]|jgi:hypothetical protein
MSKRTVVVIALCFLAVAVSALFAFLYFQKTSRSVKHLIIDQTVRGWTSENGGDMKPSVQCYVRNTSTFRISGIGVFECTISYEGLQEEFLNALPSLDPDIKGIMQQKIDREEASPKVIATYNFLTRASRLSPKAKSEPVVWEKDKVPPPKILLIRQYLDVPAGGVQNVDLPIVVSPIDQGYEMTFRITTLE